MRYVAYAFHGLLALFLLGISFIAIVSNTHSLHLEMLPWKGPALSYWVFFGALAGLITVLLALKGMWRVLFLVWSVAVALVMVKGYVFSPLAFDSRGEFSTAVWLLLGALVSLAGAWFQFRNDPLKRKFY